MDSSRAVAASSAKPSFRFAPRPHVFNVQVVPAARLAAGILGLAVLVRDDQRQFRFAVTSNASGSASSDDLAASLTHAIEGTCGIEGHVPVVEEVTVLLRSGSLPIHCEGVTSENLLPLLQRVVPNIVASGTSSRRG